MINTFFSYDNSGRIHLWLRKSSAASDAKLLYFKRKVLEALKASAEREKKEVRKALIDMEAAVMEKAGYPVGTIREWKGRKFIKIAPGKWRPKYDSETRGAKLSVKALMRKVDACTSSEELLQLVLANKPRFTDAVGGPLDIVRELSDYVSKKNDELISADIKQTYKNLTQKQLDDKMGDLRWQINGSLDHKGRSLSEDRKQQLQAQLKAYQELFDARKKKRPDFVSRNGEKVILKGEEYTIYCTAENPNHVSLKRTRPQDNGNPYMLGYTALQAQRLLNKEGAAALPKAYAENVYPHSKTENTSSGVQHDGDYALTKSGSKDFGEITADMAKVMRRQAGKIRLRIDGEKHIERPERLAQLKANGFDNARDLIEHTCADFDAIYKGKKASLTLYKKGEKDTMCFVELTPANDGDFYDVKTALVTRKDYTKNKTPLWEKSVNGVSSSSERAQSNQPTSKAPSAIMGKHDDASISPSSEKSSGIDALREKYSASPSVTGDDYEIYLAGDGGTVQGTWKLVEADAPSASHDEQTFNKTEGFPTADNGGTVNDRDYEHDSAAKENVMTVASDYDGRAVGMDEPVVVTEDGIVISGNNRTMSSKLAARKGTDKKYIDALTKKAKRFGFTSKDVAKFKHPRVVFEVAAPDKYTTELFAQFNKSDKKAMSPIEAAVKVCKTMKAETIEGIAGKIAEFDTMGEMYADSNAMTGIFSALIQGGTITRTDLPMYFANNSVTGAGKEFLETVLVGSVINENNIRQMGSEGGKAIRQKLVRAILPLVENKSMGGYSINNEVNEAVRIALAVAKDRKTYHTIDDYMSQGDMFGKKADPVVVSFAKKIDGNTQKEFAQFMQDLDCGLRPAANGEMDIFAGNVETKEDIINRVLKMKKAVSAWLARLVA